MTRNYPVTVEDTIIEGQPANLRGRVESAAGTALVQANVTSIAYYIFDNEDAAAVSDGTLVVATVIFDVLQSWTQDSTGYNFEGTIPTSKLSQDGDFVYWIEVIVILTTAEKVPLFFKLTQVPLLSAP